MPVLTDDDLRSFDDLGYVLVHDAVPVQNCQAVIDTIFAFLEMDPDDPDDWYRPPLNRGGMTEMYQHPTLWANRQHPKVHQIFSEILGTEKLWVSIDRVNFNPPVRDDHPEYSHNGFLHWDLDPHQVPADVEGRAPLGVQGVLYLTQTPPERGGFQCVPGHHLLLQRWATTGEAVPGAPDARDGRSPSHPERLAATPIPGDAGDLLIWDRRLLHGNGKNASDRPRFAQYLSMGRAPQCGTPEVEARRLDRIRQWEERRAPVAPWVVGDPRDWEHHHPPSAALTPLGRKLLGLDAW